MYHVITDYIDFFATNLLLHDCFYKIYLLLNTAFSVISSYHRDISFDSVREHGINSSSCLNIFVTHEHPIKYVLPSE